SLESEGLLWFDRASRKWCFDQGKIRRAPMTDNVVDLMAQKLRRLPRDTQDTLALASCIGNSFSLSTLSIIRESSCETVSQALWPAVLEGLLRPAGDQDDTLADGASPGLAAGELKNAVFRFLHDRVQQAAYQLIAPENRPSVHLSAGRLLLAEA